MNRFGVSLAVILLTGALALGGPIPQPSRRSSPTKLAHFEMGVYLAREGTRLHVNVDKELGGQVNVQIRDLKGNVYFERTMSAVDTQVRLSMDLSELNDGDYLLKVTNGLDMMVRDIKLATKRPTPTTRSLTIQ